MRRWSIPSLVSQLRQAFFSPWRRKPQPIILQRLHAEPLEDRIVLDAVAPGSWWDDGYWQNGSKVGVTVTLQNLGGGWLEVSGGGGAVSVSPGAPPPPDPGGYGGEVPPEEIAAFAFEVYGALGDGSGDVTWSGAADNLYIKATGDVSSVSIGGDLYVDAGWTIGDLSGRDVSARAGKSIGNVSAGDDVGTITAGTSIGTVSATDDIGEATASTSVGAVSAGGDVTRVSAGTNTSSVSAGGWLGSVYAGLDVGGVVSAGLSIGGAYIPGADPNDFSTWYYATYYGGVSAGRDVVGPVTAGGSIVGVSAGRDILDEVTANGGDIWSVRAGGGGVFTPSPDPEFPEEGEWTPYAPGRVVGSVTASRDVHSVEATGDILGAVRANSGFVLGVKADGSVAGAVTAQTDVGRSVVRDPAPDWRPFGYYSTPAYPSGVSARDGDVSGPVTATTGDVTSVTAGRDVSWAVTAAGDIGSVGAGQHVGGAVTAGRDIGSVRAGGWDEMPVPDETSMPGDVSGNVTAGRDVGEVTATQDVAGAVTAGRNIGLVQADRDVSGVLVAETGGIRQILAGLDITGGATAAVGIGYWPGETPPWEDPYFSGPIPPQVEAGRDITGSLTAQTGNIGWVKEYLTIGEDGEEDSYVRYGGGVMAGRHIDGDVRAEEGGIAAVVAGADPISFGPGRLGGFVFADKYDLSVAATGDVSQGASAGWGVDLTAGGDVTGEVTAQDGKAVVTAGGEVDAAIRGRRGVTVMAALGGVAGSVVAGDDEFWADAQVLAGGIVTAPVTATGAAYVDASGAVAGAISGWGHVDVSAGGDVTGSVTSHGLEASVFASGSVSGSVSAPYGVMIDAGGSVTGPITAGDLDQDAWGDAEVFAGGDVTGNISAVGGALVTAGGMVSGAVSTTLNEAVVSAGGVISGAVSGDYAVVKGKDVTGPVSAALGVEAHALVDITGGLLSSGGQIFAWAGRHVTGAITAGLEVYIEAGGCVSGNVSAGNESIFANALVRADGNVSGNVVATASAEVWAGGDITGDVIAGNGEAIALAGGYVSGVVSSGINWLRVWAPKGTGRATSDYPDAPPPSDWLMVIVRGDPGDLTGSLIANGATDPQFVAATLADPPPGQQPGPNDDRGRATAAADELKQKLRVPTLPSDLLENFRGWTKEEYFRRVKEVTEWWNQLQGDDAELLQVWWGAATAAEQKQLIRDLLDAFSDTQRDSELSKRIGPPLPAPEPVEPNPEATKAGPTDAQLKQWSDDVNAYAKASAAAADAKIKAYDDDGARRARLSKAFNEIADSIQQVNPNSPNAVQYRGWATQILDRINFEVGPGGPPRALTKEGQQLAQALQREVEELKNIAKMDLEQKLQAALQRALDAKDAEGKSKLEGELREAVLELVKPQNLAIMAGAMAGLGVAAMTPAGPVILGGATVFGYIMTGKAVLEIGEDVFKFLGIAANARRPEDFNRAADHLIKALKGVVGEAAPALAGVGAVKVVKGAANLKAVKEAGGDAKNLTTRRADGKMQVNDGQPKAQPQPGQPAEVAAVPPVGTAKRRPKAPDAPAGLSDADKLLWTKLHDALGEDVVKAVIKNVEGDAAKLGETLKHLDTVLDRTTKWRGTNRPRTLVDTPEKVEALLKQIFIDNKQKLQELNVRPEDLLRNLATIADVEGFVPTLKRDPKTGRDVVQVKTSDMDLVAGGVLWQVKVGPEALTNLDSFRVWLKVAVEHARKTDQKVGLMLDPQAKATFDASPTCKKLWDEAKAVLGQDRVTIQVIDPP
jgi:hypothetical protein